MKVIKKRNLGGVAALVGGAMALGVMCQPALADNVHFNCLDGSPACVSSGGSIPTGEDSTNPPNFQIQWAGGGNKSGDLIVVFLIPEADGTLSTPISVTGTGENGAVSATATLVSSTAWTSGHLDSYLGISSQTAANNIGNYGDSYVYEADLGTQTLCHNGSGGSCTAGEELDLTSSDLPQDSYILGFLHSGSKWYGTPNSETLEELGSPAAPPPPATPEPSSLALLGTGALGLAGVVRRRFRRS